MPRRVGHVKKDFGLRCDRATPLGNPFALDSSRSICVELYRRYIGAVLLKNEEPTVAATNLATAYGWQLENCWLSKGWTRVQVVSAFRSLQVSDITLLCWCRDLSQQAPACHCDRLVAAAEYFDTKNLWSQI